MTFMGSLEASNGRWGMFTDVVYMDIGNTKSGYRDFTLGGSALPAGADANVSYDLKGWAWTLACTWRIASNPASKADLVAGARLCDVNQPGAAGNRGAGAPGVGVRDPGLNQPGVAGDGGDNSIQPAMIARTSAARSSTGITGSFHHSLNALPWVVHGIRLCPFRTCARAEGSPACLARCANRKS
jgi:hypothetical protein